MITATKLNDIKLVKLLIEAKMDVNERLEDDNDLSTLYYACINNNCEMVDLLLNNDVKLDDTIGCYRFNLCLIDNKISDYVAYDIPIIFIAVLNNNEKIVKSLIEHGCNADSSFCIKCDHTCICAHKDNKCKHYISLLNLAIINKNAHIATLLLDHFVFNKLNALDKRKLICMFDDDNSEFIDKLNHNDFVNILEHCDNDIGSAKLNSLLQKVLFKCTSYENVSNNMKIYVKHKIYSEITESICLIEHGLYKLIFEYLIM